MPKTEGDPLGPGFESRLRAALDRVEVPHSAPRYHTAPAVKTWRLAPAALVVGITGVLVLTLFAATGSSNPAELERHIVNVIQPSNEPSPSPTPEIKAAPVAPEKSPSAEPTETPGPTERPEPNESPKATPSPEPRENGSDSPSATPTPNDQ